MEQIKRSNAEITDYCVQQDVSFSPVLLFSPMEVEKREIPDRPIEVDALDLDAIDSDVEAGREPIQQIEFQPNPNSAAIQEEEEEEKEEKSAMKEPSETEVSASDNSLSTDQLASILQDIRDQLIALASPVLSQLQSDSLLPSSLSATSISPERIA